MTSLLAKIKSLFRAPNGAVPDRLYRFLPIIEGDDPVAVEGARDWVEPADIPALIAHYWQVEDWSQKRALVDILQEQYHDDLPALMLDFLRAPVAPGDEPTELSQAAALGFVDEKYDQFMTYYNDREKLGHDVREVLRRNGLQAVPAPAPPPRPAPAPPPADAPQKSPNQRLMNAAIAGDLPAVQQALADGANIDVPIGRGNKVGSTALIMALLHKNYDVADYLIEQGADVNHTRGAEHPHNPAHGQTPLWWAANHGHMDLAQKLLDKGADVNIPDHHGGTPLSQAAGSGHLEMVRFLVDKGADIHAPIYDGRTAFNLAVTNGHKRVAEFLLRQGDDVNGGGSSGYTPLMVAAENNFYDLAKLLIARGADVNAVHPGPGIYIGLRGRTPLVFAVAAGYVRMTKLLIQHGADVHYVVPAGHNYKGEPTPARPVVDFAAGKRAESVRQVLREAAAE